MRELRSHKRGERKREKERCFGFERQRTGVTEGVQTVRGEYSTKKRKYERERKEDR